MKNTAHFVIGIFGNVVGLFVFLAPVITFRRIYKKRSTEEFSGFPYVMTLFKCLVTAWYGLPLVSPHNLLLLTINGAGIALETIYVVIYLIFAPMKEKRKIFGLLALVLGMLAGVVLVSVFALHGSHRKLFCGVASAFVTIMYASPLTIIIGDKNKKRGVHAIFLVPVPVLGGISFLLFGLLENDPFVSIPNGFGCGLGTIQLILYAIFPKNKSNFKKSTTGGCLEVDAANSLVARHRTALGIENSSAVHQLPEDAAVDLSTRTPP